MVNSFIYGSHKRTLLHKAAEIGDRSICNLLIDHGADVNKEDARKQTPLFLAAKNGHEDICKVLIEKCSFVNIKDYTGKTPLMIAAKKSFEDVCKILIVNGADPWEMNDSKVTALNLIGNNINDKFKLWRTEFGKMSNSLYYCTRSESIYDFF